MSEFPSRNSGITKRLVGHRSDIKTLSRAGNMVLSAAASSGSVEVVKFFPEQGMRVDELDENSLT